MKPIANSSPLNRDATVSSPTSLENDGGNGAQQLVADFITMAVVDRLEAVHAERNDGQPFAAARGFFAQLLAAVRESLAVGEAGDGVADGH